MDTFRPSDLATAPAASLRTRTNPTVAPVSSKVSSTTNGPSSNPKLRISRKTGRLGLHSVPPARLSSNPAASLRTRICRKTGPLGWAPPDQLDRFPSSQLLYGPNYGEKRSDADKVTVSRTRVNPPSTQGKSTYRISGQHTRARRTRTSDRVT